MEAVDHFELSAQVLLGEVVEHARVDEALHEGAAVLREAQTRQPLVPDPLVVHLAERQRLVIVQCVTLKCSTGLCRCFSKWDCRLLFFRWVTALHPVF